MQQASKDKGPISREPNDRDIMLEFFRIRIVALHEETLKKVHELEEKIKVRDMQVEMLLQEIRRREESQLAGGALARAVGIRKEEQAQFVPFLRQLFESHKGRTEPIVLEDEVPEKGEDVKN